MLLNQGMLAHVHTMFESFAKVNGKPPRLSKTPCRTSVCSVASDPTQLHLLWDGWNCHVCQPATVWHSIWREDFGSELEEPYGCCMAWTWEFNWLSEGRWMFCTVFWRISMEIDGAVPRHFRTLTGPEVEINVQLHLQSMCFMGW